jgi:hypothetical protein
LGYPGRMPTIEREDPTGNERLRIREEKAKDEGQQQRQ